MSAIIENFYNGFLATDLNVEEKKIEGNIKFSIISHIFSKKQN